MMKWETVIGLEVHAQLKTQTKLFCRCANHFGDVPNANTCAVCLGLPGALPALNEKAVELAVRAALALECEIQPRSQFARKNYFYPDLPKGYQISQFESPYCLRGKLAVNGRDIRLVRIHMEEDAGKNIHTSGDASLVDYNRGGTPLCEIVSEPDLRTAEEAAEYLRELRNILMAIDVCDGNMEEGSFRCDANVSIRQPGEPLGTRVELKNINSFKFVIAAIHYEETRQREVLLGGGKVVQETRQWDSEAKVSRSMRSKEDAMDYRYFPDPDLPPVVISRELVEKVRRALPELPKAKSARLAQAHGFSLADAALLARDALFEETHASVKDAKLVGNFIINTVRGEEQQISSVALSELLALVQADTISLNVAKTIYKDVLHGRSAKELVAEKGLAQSSDTGPIEAAASAVIAANAKNVEGYRAGNEKLFGFFVGQTMKALGGKANPKLVNDVLRQLLGPTAG